MPSMKDQLEKAFNQIDQMAGHVAAIPYIQKDLEENAKNIQTLFGQTRALDKAVAAQQATCKARHNGNGSKPDPVEPECNNRVEFSVRIPFSGKQVATGFATLSALIILVSTLATVLS